MSRKILKVGKNLLGIAVAFGLLMEVRWLKVNLEPLDVNWLTVYLALLAVPTGVVMLCYRAPRNTWLEKFVTRSDYPNQKMGRVEQLLWHILAVLVLSECILGGYIRF